MASVIRLNAGGSTTIEKIGLTVEQAKEIAATHRAACSNHPHIHSTW